MPKKSSPTATQHDLQQLLEHVASLIGASEERMTARMETMLGQMETGKEETVLHFDVVAENLTADFRGALADKIGQHEDRIVVLEQRAGIRP